MAPRYLAGATHPILRCGCGWRNKGEREKLAALLHASAAVAAAAVVSSVVGVAAAIEAMVLVL